MPKYSANKNLAVVQREVKLDSGIALQIEDEDGKILLPASLSLFVVLNFLLANRFIVGEIIHADCHPGGNIIMR